LPSKFRGGLALERQYRFLEAEGTLHELAGGWSDPFARDPERVLRDVMEEKISPAYARPARSSSYPDPPSFQVKSVMLIR
jgi:N-methylhydantoinase B/oxoprolinase/acetone carboxylase alpha subunit